MSPKSDGDYYEVLQVSRNADFETIERVFRLLAKRYHPDNVLSVVFQEYAGYASKTARFVPRVF